MLYKWIQLPTLTIPTLLYQFVKPYCLTTGKVYQSHSAGVTRRERERRCSRNGTDLYVSVNSSNRIVSY